MRVAVTALLFWPALAFADRFGINEASDGGRMPTVVTVCWIGGALAAAGYVFVTDRSASLGSLALTAMFGGIAGCLIGFLLAFVTGST